ncbi:hypothetical protein LINPERHAP1_LOCUS31426 [Linum perenne]
MFLW